jgi:cytochrome c oxidase cbb3-type subunit 3
MGPSLRDTIWKYGGTDSAIVASIRQGRPAGMPKWAGIVPDTGIARMLVYIRSLRTSAEPTFFFSPNDTTTHADLRALASP